ncbi:MAG: hypothetical protein ACYDA6_05195, partial [Solirubrobacteraceae bacterium]
PGGVLYASIVPQSNQLRLDLDTLPATSPDPPNTAESESSAATQQLFQGLPEGTWVGFGLENLPDGAAKGLALLPALLGTKQPTTGAGRSGAPRNLLALIAGALSSVGPSLGTFSALIKPVQRALGAMAAQEPALRGVLAGWVGPAAIFVSGASLLELNAAIVIDSKDNARSVAAVAGLAQVMRRAGIGVRQTSLPGAEAAITASITGLPLPIQVADGAGRFVIGLGASPVQAALTPSATLGSSAAYRAATSALGEGLQPRLLVNVPQLNSVLSLLGATSAPALSQVAPYLHALSTIVLGIGRIGTAKRTAVVVSLG